MYSQDNRTVLTLDAGGQSFRFSAMKGNKEITESVRLLPDVSNLQHCLNTLVAGFSQTIKKLQQAPVAISFAFPGPADYPRGIIGNLPNLPAFGEGGVPLKDFLEHKFNLPTFINNDGDLFAYGEALAGFLPHVNRQLKEAGSTRRYKNLVGVTLGTGFGCGIVHGKELAVGDNAAAAEVWCMRGKLNPRCIVEDSVNSAAVIRYYLEQQPNAEVSAADVYLIAKGEKEGNRLAAIHAFESLGEALGDALANIAAVVDGLVVVGGGVAGAYDLFISKAIAAMNGTMERANGALVPRTELTAYDVENKQELSKFIAGSPIKIQVPETSIFVDHDPVKRIGIGRAQLGDSRAMAVGAYCFALNGLDR